MNRRIAAIRRGGLVVFAGIALTLISAQAPAQTCNGNPKAKIDPVSQTVAESIPGTPTIVHLNGSKSTPNNATLLWQQIPVPPPPPPLPASPAAPAVTLSNPTAAIPTFTAPSIGPTVLRFRLTVTCGTSTDSTTTDINVTDVVTNAPPTAAATASHASAYEGNVVTLDGTASYDIDPGSTLTYSWAQTGASPTSPQVTLSNANPAGSIVTFLAPNTPVATGAVLTFRLTVSDGRLTGTADQSVNIVWSNDPPVASLVCPADGVFIVDEGGPVTLDGSGSSDADGGIASYSWSQAVGLPNLGVAGLTTPSISFNAPSLGYNQFGSLTLKLTVTDNVGAIDEAVCSVWINDVTPPTIAVPADETIEADFAGGKAFIYTVMAFDAVDDQEPHALACSPPSGSDFPLSAAPSNQTTTAVACSTVDAAGNIASAGFNVTVQDTTAPVITVPGSFALQATGPTGAVANYTATTADAVDGAGAAICVPASGSLFALGTTPVACNATDARGNAAEPQTFNLTVHDTIPPVIAAHANVGPVEATGSSGAAVSYASPATADIVDGAGTATCLPASGNTFPLGISTVTCNAVDAAGNPAVATSFTVTVHDTTAPVIAAHADVGPVEATGPAGAAVSYASPATSDLVDGAGAATCLAASGTTFPLGTSTVTCNANDAAGNPAESTSFTVTVHDTTAPVIAAHADVGPVEATGPAGAAVSYASPATSDLVDGAGTASCAPASGGSFALGETTVFCAAVDHAGNAARLTTFNVIVVDTTPPMLSGVSANMTGEATSPAGAVVSWNAPTAWDIVDGSRQVACAPASGSTFALGTTEVTCSASDNGGRTTSQSFTVTVQDTTGPVIAQLATIPAVARSPAMVVFPQVYASDAVGVTSLVCRDAIARVFVAGQAYPFPVGYTEVTCTALDAAGNRGEMRFSVHVTYDWNGFFQPVDNNNVNTAKAGSAIPVKFSLGGDQGLDIFAGNSPASGTSSCDATSADEIEVLATTTAGGSTLSYDAASGQYIYVWKTDKSWLGCRQLRVTLKDGSVVKTAMFKFR